MTQYFNWKREEDIILDAIVNGDILTLMKYENNIVEDSDICQYAVCNLESFKYLVSIGCKVSVWCKRTACIEYKKDVIRYLHDNRLDEFPCQKGGYCALCHK